MRTHDAASSWVAFNGSCIVDRIRHCGAQEVTITSTMRECLDPRIASLTSVVISEPPTPLGNGDLCVSNSGRLYIIIMLLFVFSLCVQMSEGLTYGVVPSVSRPALGVVSGMVGAGGNVGAVITNVLFFKGDALRTDQGLVYMGFTILAVTASLVLVYFPEHGSMITRAGAMRYDPQLVKPPAGYRGADLMDYSITPTPATIPTSSVSKSPVSSTLVEVEHKA